MTHNRNLSGCQIFFATDLPQNWECSPLEVRMEFLYGRALHKNDRHPGIVDVYGSNGKVGTHNVKWLEGPGVLVGRKGTVGAVQYSYGPFWPIDTVYYINPAREDVPRFLFYLLQYLPLSFLNAATGVPGLSRRDAYALRGAFPPRDEQTCIARMLDTVERSIDRTSQKISKANELKTALAQKLFSEGTRRQKLKKTQLGFIPESWEVLPVGEVALHFQYGLSVSMQLTGTIPILRMGNIQNGGVMLDDLKFVTLAEKVTNPYLLRKGDVLFNRTNSQELVGKVGIYRENAPAVFASYLIRVIPNPDLINNYFLGQVLDSYSAQCRIKRYATPGVQQVNINATNLGKVLIPIPVGEQGLEEQQQIAELLEQADESIRRYQSVLAAQRTLKQSLMRDLLTGRARVNGLG